MNPQQMGVKTNRTSIVRRNRIGGHHNTELKTCGQFDVI
jgi:hypothetical protein